MLLNAKKHTHETGNAVTLTLLGLSVAILAGVVVLYFIGKTKPERVYIPDSVDEEVFDEGEMDTLENEMEDWNTYTNTTYDFTLQFPDGWVVATGTVSSGDPAISVYRAVGTSTDLVFGQEDAVSHVSIYPKGIATGGISAQMKASDVIIEVPQASAKDYVLKTGRAWATKGVFDQYPDSWTASGFIFSRTKIEQEELLYMRGDTEIEQHEFDPFAGDHIERIGFIDTEVREIQENILRSFHFINQQSSANETVAPSVSLETPTTDQIVTSPLLVRGTTQRGWYYGDDFMIQLLTNEDEIVTEVSVVPQEEDDLGEALYFEVSLVFEPTTATSGKLVIGANDLIETDTEEEALIVPVRFTQAEKPGSDEE